MREKKNKKNKTKKKNMKNTRQTLKACISVVARQIQLKLEWNVS